MRIGVFGGTFDPVHKGHVGLAESCEQQVRLDRVLFVPAAHQPHKPQAPRASDVDRATMLRLATAGRPAWAVSTVELERGGQSYTVDTLRQLKAEHPADELFFLLGADALADLPRWREPQAICELATPVAVHRGGMPAPDFDALAPLVGPERLAAIRALHVEMPPETISSSEIQRLIAAGEAWRSLVPDGVADYIIANRLYGTV